MAIVLRDYTQTATTFKSGQESNIPVAAGQILRIETSPGGAEILDVEVPVGKAWSVRIIVEVHETDA